MVWGCGEIFRVFCVCFFVLVWVLFVGLFVFVLLCFIFYTHTQQQSNEKTTSLKHVNQSKKQHDLHADSSTKTFFFHKDLIPCTVKLTMTIILEGLRILTDTCSHKEKI